MSHLARSRAPRREPLPFLRRRGPLRLRLLRWTLDLAHRFFGKRVRRIA